MNLFDVQVLLTFSGTNLNFVACKNGKGSINCLVISVICMTVIIFSRATLFGRCSWCVEYKMRDNGFVSVSINVFISSLVIICRYGRNVYSVKKRMFALSS